MPLPDYGHHWGGGHAAWPAQRTPHAGCTSVFADEVQRRPGRPAENEDKLLPILFLPLLQ